MMEYQGLGFVDAVHELAKRVGMTVPQKPAVSSRLPHRRRHWYA